MHSSILGLAAIALGAPALAQGEWITVSSSSDSGSVHSIRTVDIPSWSPGNRANQVWLKSDLKKEETVSFSKVVALNVVNCPDRNFKTLLIRAYYRDGTNEELPTDPDRTIALSPDSVIGRVADVVCQTPQPE
jgi:S-adenosylmethionine:diacylglycerol 3-amino-3-carboxypropyl transferase